MLRMLLLIVMVTITMATLFALNVREAPVGGVVASEAVAAMVVAAMVVVMAVEEAIQEDTEVVMIEGQVAEETVHNRHDDLITELMFLVRCSDNLLHLMLIINFILKID